MERDVNWVGKIGDSNPLTGIIQDVTEAQGKKGLKHVLVIRAAEGLRQMDLYGDNKNVLIDRYGPDEKKWLGQKVQVLTEELIGGKGKTRKIL